MTAFARLLAAWFVAALALGASMAHAQVRITEYMYKGANGEFIEFTNVGAAAVDMSGWSFDGSNATPGAVNLSAFGTVTAGESVILTEAAVGDFRAAWSLFEAVKVIGGNSDNIGRDDEINLYDANDQLVDRLAYGDDSLGGPRTSNASARVTAAGLGNDNATDWVLSSPADMESSVVSAGGDIGSPGRSTRATVAFNACQPAVGTMRISEYMYGGADGEFVEFTNVGTAAVDMTGWSFDDSSETPRSQDLSAYGTVQPGESVLLADAGVSAEAFRANWGLCAAVKVIGNNTNNLGRDDEINLYDASNTLIDRLTYGDDTLGGPRANALSAWTSADGLGNNIIDDWTLSSVGDAESSFASTGGDIGSPGKSTRATVAFDPCVGGAQSPMITVDDRATSIYLDLGDGAGGGAVSGVIGDPSDPAASTGIGFDFALADGGDASTLTITVSSSNEAVIDAGGLALTGSGAQRQLTIEPIGVGYATITLSATDDAGNTGTYAISYAASAAAALPDDTHFHTGASDASATIALDDDTMIVADDETNVLRVYDRNHSGLPLAGFDFSTDLALPDPDNPELDLEGSARIADRLFWTGSYSNSKNFHVRPNRHRVFATDLAGRGDDAVLSYAGRYDWLLEDMVAWDEADGHGLGANFLGFAASSAEGVDSKTSSGFNIEGLAMAPDNATAYFAFRAPQLPVAARHQALIVPVRDFAELVAGDAPDSRPPGTATFGQPILLDLGGRGLRSLDRNAAGQYLITAGPAGDATGVPPDDFRLFAWTGNPTDAPFDLGVDLTGLDVNGGSFESIAEVPEQLGQASVLQFLFDNGDSVWYGDGIAAKDLAESRFKKAASLKVTVDVTFPAATLSAVAGTPQQAPVLQPFASPLEVHVTDAYGNAAVGVSVDFSTPGDGASAFLSGPAAITDSEGSARVTATANASAGSYVISASVGGVASSAHFDLTNIAGPPVRIEATGGTPQSAIVGQRFNMPLSVDVTDSNGNAVAGAVITYTAPASGASAILDGASTTSDVNGDASVLASANAIVGSYIVDARIDGVATAVSFVLSNSANPATDPIFGNGFDAPTR